MNKHKPQEPVKDNNPLIIWALHSPIGRAKTVEERQLPEQQTLKTDNVVRFEVTGLDAI